MERGNRGKYLFDVGKGASGMKCGKCGGAGGVAGFLGVTGEYIYLNDGQPAKWLCDSCVKEWRATSNSPEDVERRRQTEIVRRAEKVVVTSTPSIEGHRIRQYLGLESVEFVIGTGLFSEVWTDIQDFFGARSTPFEKKLAKAKSVAMRALQVRAAEKGGNAVVAADLDFTEFSGNRVGLILNGTVVQAVPLKSK